jgi:hypothetical protein
MITNAPAILDVTAMRGTGHDISVTAHIQSADGVKLPTSRTSHGFQPMMVTVDWKWSPVAGQYIADSVMVAGDCYRQDGTVGTHRASTDWKMYGAGDVQKSHDLPAWLDQLVYTLRPAPLDDADAQAALDAHRAAVHAQQAAKVAGDKAPALGNVDILTVDTHTTSTVRTHVTGAPQVKASYLDRWIIPAHVTADFTYDAGADWWRCVRVELKGPRVLKPKADGTVRLGKDWHARSWSSYSKGDVQTDGADLPGWLDDLVSELRPNGTVALPGM